MKEGDESITSVSTVTNRDGVTNDSNFALPRSLAGSALRLSLVKDFRDLQSNNAGEETDAWPTSSSYPWSQ